MNVPPGSDNYPDDGTVIFEELDLAAGIPFRLPFRNTSNKIIFPVILYELLGSWTEDDDHVPAFMDNWVVQPFTPSLPIFLGAASAAALRADGEVIHFPGAFSKARLQVAYPVPPEAGDQYRFLHLRGRLMLRSSATDTHGVPLPPEPETFSGGWDWIANPPEAPANYDPDDVLTWPRFDVVSPVLPAAGSAPTPADDGVGTSSSAEIYFQFTWPRPQETIIGSGSYAPGRIPGDGFDWLCRWQAVMLTRGLLPL